MNKKFLLLSLFFLAGLTYDSFNGHFDHFDYFDHHKDSHLSECQACEENVDIKIATTKNKSSYTKISPKTSLTSRFVNRKNKSNLSRAPPLN
ncbi:MAG: hypothetical protein CMQ83_03880 [Gammaproteobacteria bacterium]|nr:hypothetical protein [Gammaproteobacteria bacterium]